MSKNFLVVAFACALGIGCIEAEAFQEPDATEDSKTVDHSEVTLPDADVQDPDTVDPDVVLTEVVCESDSDCANITKEVCQLASCHGSGVCILVDAPDGAQCADDDPCTIEETCLEGACTAGGEMPCDDGIDCTDDSCDSETGCVSVPDDGQCGNDPCISYTCDTDDGCLENHEVLVGTECDDGNACTGDWDDGADDYVDTCKKEVTPGICPFDGDKQCTTDDDCEHGPCTETQTTYFCGGADVECDDENPCTDNYCDGLDGCEYPINEDSCEDGDACTEADQCQDGECISGDALNCDDGNDCTLDKCDDEDGCVHEANPGFPCDDENACTGHPLPGDLYKDYCESEPLTDSGVCLSDGDPSPGDDDPCTVDEDCLSYDENEAIQFCQDVTETAVCAGPEIACDDGNECTQDICDLESGCVSDDLSGVLCHEYDDDPCVTGFVLCDQGACVTTVDNDVVCDDDNVCTDEFCDPSTEEGCQYAHVDGDCVDDDACTENETCVEQECVGQPVDCDDGEVCTAEYCSTLDGCVTDVNVGAECDDGDPCTVGDACETDGECAQGAQIDCDDLNPCTTDSCDDGACLYVNNSVSCSDDNACTENDVCADGSCIGDDVDCGDDTACVQHQCHSEVGCQVFFPNGEPCNDNNPCTTHSECDDSGTCEGSGELNCNDDNPCTTDDCDAGDGGCVYSEAEGEGECNDQDPCTEDDACSESVCEGTSKDCDDGNDCTTDSCDAQSGDCVHVSEGCECTSDTGCVDTKICTLDTCVAGSCVNTNQLGGPCEDGDPCTVSSSCNANGECRAAANEHKDCDDFNSCTPDSCVVGEDGEAVCIHVGLDLIGESCDDGLPCTVNDVCVVNGASAQCQGSNYVCPPISCSVGSCTGPGDDGPECTYNTAFNQDCDDGDACTSGDSCAIDGSCSGEGVNCVPDDPNPCRVYSCNPIDGSCVSDAASVETSCDDEDPCTVNDHCHGSASTCVGGGALSCNDGNECTQDSCSAVAGGAGGSPCIHQAVQGQGCDDEDPCTLGDICTASSECLGFVEDCDDNNPCTSGICDPGPGGGVCIFEVNEGLGCNDGDACTSGETCDFGAACSGGSVDSWAVTQGLLDVDDEARDIVALASGGWIAVGRRGTGGNTKNQGWIVRFDDQGSVVWTTLVGGEGNDVLNGVTLRPDDESEIIAVGGKEENATGVYVERPWAVLVSVANGVVMVNTYSPGHAGSLRAVAPTEWSDGVVGKYVMVGQVDVGESERGLVTLAFATGKISNGAPVWQKELIQGDKINHVELSHISVLGTNSYLVAGAYKHQDAGSDWDAYLAETSYGAAPDYMVVSSFLIWGEGQDDKLFDADTYTVENGANVSTRVLGVGMSETVDDADNLYSRGLIVEWDLGADMALWTGTGGYMDGEPAALRAVAPVASTSIGVEGWVIAGKTAAKLDGNGTIQGTGWLIEFKKGDQSFPSEASTTVYDLTTTAGFSSVAVNAAESAYGVAGARHSTEGDLQAFVVQTKLSGGVCGL